MTTNKPEVFEVYRTKQGTLENVVLLADYEALQAERDALAVSVERYRATYAKLTNAECTQDADTGEYMRLADRKLMDELDAIAEETPTASLARLKTKRQPVHITSLTHLKAEWQAEVLEEAGRYVRCEEDAALLRINAQEFRRQAEKAGQTLNDVSEALKREDLSKKEALELDSRLRKVLDDTDPFWMRWRFVAEKKGWL